MTSRTFFVALYVAAGCTCWSQISPGRLAVVRLGDGGGLTSAGAAVQLVSMDKATGTVLGESIDITYDGTTGLVLTGNTTGEGSLASLRTTTGTFALISGYPAFVGTGSLTTSPTKRVTRVRYFNGAMVDQDLTLAGQARSAVSLTGLDFYFSTGTVGVNAGSFGSGTTTSQSTETNTRFLDTWQGRAYFSTASGGNNIVREAVPGGGGPVLLSTGSAVLIADFEIARDGLTLYVASDSTTLGGIYRYSRPSLASAWDSGTRLTTQPVRYLALEETAGQHNLYASFKSSTRNDIEGFFDTKTATSLSPAWTITPPGGFGYAGLDLVQSPLAQVSGTLVLEGFEPSTAGQTVRVEVLQGGTVVESLQTALGADDTFLFTAESEGSATLRFSFRTGLLKAVAVDLAQSPISGLQIMVLNGDCDGDNEVSIGDFALLSGAFGANLGDPGYDEDADLNGDGSVDIGDFALLSTNFGEIGD